MLKPFYDCATFMIIILICSNALVMSSVFVLIHQTRLIVIEVFFSNAPRKPYILQLMCSMQTDNYMSELINR